jgi:hypothetical protein
MKSIIAITLLSIQTISSTYSEVPKKFSDQIRLTAPKNNLITINDQLKVTGRADKYTEIRVNGNPVKNNEKGPFEYIETIQTLGKQTISIEFKRQNESFLIKRNVIKLKNPESIIMTQKELAFINTNLVSNRVKRLSLTNKFTKDELAYFLDKITSKSSDKNLKIKNIESIRRYKNEIQRVIDSKILSLSQNGNFNSNQEIRLIIFLTGVANALGYQPSDTVYQEIEKFKGKWFYKTLVVALDKKIVTTKDIDKLQKPLTNAQFIIYSSRIPEINQQISSQLSFNADEEQIKKESSIGSKNNAQAKKVSLTIDKVIKLSPNRSQVHGQATPSKAFVLNWKKVVPDSNGYFSFIVPSKKNNVQLNFGNDVVVKEISELTQEKIRPISSKQKKLAISSTVKDLKKPNQGNVLPYNDLKRHWIEKIANELKRDGKLNNTPKFYPNQHITRADLATFIVNINGIKKKKSQANSFSDIQITNPHYHNIQTVVSNKLLNGMSPTSFDPNRKVTKLQAIIVASRMLPEPDDYTKIELPYNDISKYKWAINYLKKAYHHKIISSDKKLNPKKLITKAELVSLLYKSSKI